MAEENTQAEQFRTMEELRDFIKVTLCNHEDLEVGAWPMSEQPLCRGGVPCGLLFCLQGPRTTTFTAILDTKTNTALFYGTTGQRFLTKPILLSRDLLQQHLPLATASQARKVA